MIDFDKPLECDYGNVKVLPDSKGSLFVQCKRVLWEVNEDGIHVDGFMPKVRNKVRKPKEGERWMVQTQGEMMALCFLRGDWYWVDSDGIPSTLFMPTVRNKARKPIEGELWWCKWELQVGNEEFKWFKEPVRFDGEKFQLVPDNANHFEILKPYKGLSDD